MQLLSCIILPEVTMIDFDLNVTHHVVAASNHTYLKPTQELNINRTFAYHDIVYLVEGEWTFIEMIDGKPIEYVMKPDSILILTAGHHEFIKKPCLPGTKTYCVHMTKEGSDLTDKENNLHIEPFFSCSDDHKIMSFFKSACDAFWSDDPFNQSEADSYITLLFCEIAKLGSENILSDEVRRTVKLINNNLTRSISKEELVECAGISYKKLAESFKAETGQTLHSYQLNKKLEMVAAQIETEPDIRIKELAATYGFYDEFYLSKLFKKKYGLSPLEYKNNSKHKRTRKYDTIC